MTDVEVAAVEAELEVRDASREIVKAVSARHSIARKYVLWLRRRNPQASPAEIVHILERHYGASITSAGALISAGVIAADIGIALVPVAGAAAAGVKSAGQQAAKQTGKQAVKAAAKGLALSAASGGAKKAATFIPAGDKQLQFEITAVFGLALADIHGMNLDKDQSFALVYGLTNERVSQKQISEMAKDVAEVSSEGVVVVGQKLAAGRGDWTHWANTLSDALPAGAAKSLVLTIETGHLDTMRKNLSGKQQSAVDYGVAAVAGGVARFVFGRDVIASSRTAFAAPPDEFPEHLQLAVKSDEGDDDGNPFAALMDAAKDTGARIADTASAVGTGVASAADVSTRVFRSVDLDGDGIPDEARAFTAVKGVGGAVAGAAGAVGGSVAGAAGAVGGTVAGLFKRKKRDELESKEPEPTGNVDEPTLD